MNPYILSIDAGTTGITIVILDQQANICKKYYKEFNQYFPKPGWVEHDGEEIWQVTYELIQLAFKDYNPRDCACIGITNQRETTLIWDRNTDQPIYHAIVWQCRRTQPICQELKQAGHETEFTKRTGLVIDSYFSGTKIKWLLDNVEGIREKAENGNLAFGTIDSWILWKLTGGIVHATDYTNASRTLIFNIDNLIWDKKLLSILNIPTSLLPEVMPSSYTYGKTDSKLFSISIPISGIAGDQQSSLYGQGCFEPGDSKCTYGTGCFILTNTGNKRINSTSGLLTTIACNSYGKPIYSLEGSIFMAGAVIQWLRDELQILEYAADSENMASSVQNSNGVVLVPAFTGLGAPYWDMNVRGIITGLTRGSNRNHIVRAALESIAFQVNDILELIYQDIDRNLPTLKVDGGACANNFLMQFQANMIQRPIDRPINIDSTALGAGMLAGLEIGFWRNSQELHNIRKTERIFTAKMSATERSAHMKAWKKAVNQAIIT